LRRDYEAARRNVYTLCNELMSRDEQAIAEGKAYPNITQTDAETIKTFFDKHWNHFAGEASQPMVALIPRSIIGKNQPLCETYTDYREADIDLVQYMGVITQDVDLRIKKALDASDIAIAKLPAYNSVHSA